MEKEFVSYEQALALKELGFDEPCLYYYKREKDNKFHLYQDDLGRWYKNTNVGEALLLWGEKYDTKQCSTPLYQQAFRWFREKYDMLSYVDVMLSDKGNWVYDYVIVSNDDYTFDDEMKWDTYEEAESTCLDKLIELVRKAK